MQRVVRVEGIDEKHLMATNWTLTLTPIAERNRDSRLQRLTIPAAERVTMGRSSSCDVHLPWNARQVSRHHATLTFLDGNWYVTDCSRRGTFIGSTRLTAGDPTPIRDGDCLRFGECEFATSIGSPTSQEAVLDVDDAFTLTLEEADPASIDASRVLKSALELPELFARATTESAIYDAACEYLVNTLFPAIASAYVTLTTPPATTEVLGRAERRLGAMGA